MAVEARPAADDRRRFAGRFLLRVVLWMAPVAALWLLATPYYNRFLAQAGENLVRLSERPPVTRLAVRPPHHALISRLDVPASRGSLGSVRLTDVHFPTILLVALCLGVPGASWRRRGEAIAWSLLFLAFFHVVSVLLWVKFVYATQLGSWSVEHYGPVARNVWGMGKHLANLPFKLGLPLALWAAFFLGELMPARAAAAPRDGDPGPGSSRRPAA